MYSFTCCKRCGMTAVRMQITCCSTMTRCLSEQIRVMCWCGYRQLCNRKKWKEIAKLDVAIDTIYRQEDEEELYIRVQSIIRYFDRWIGESRPSFPFSTIFTRMLSGSQIISVDGETDHWWDTSEQSQTSRNDILLDSSRYALMHVMAFFLVFSRRKLLKPVE